MEEEGEESKWQDRISSGFDRLVAFASTELDKRRRSTEGGDCCNTSPDSGIGHSNPSPAPSSLPHTKKPDGYPSKLKPNLKSSMLKTGLKRDSSPPIDQFVDESGPPRTPSPSSSPTCNQINYMPSYYPPDKIIRLNPALYKYQRQEAEKKQPRPDQHYKKKFFYREWRENESEENGGDGGQHHQKFHPNSEYVGGRGAGGSQSSEQWPRTNIHDMYNICNTWKN